MSKRAANTKRELPKFDETLIPVLKIFKRGVELSQKEIRLKVRGEFYSQLPIELLSSKYPVTGVNILLDRISWGISHLQRAGYLERPKRNVYKITAKGLKTRDEKSKLSLSELRNQKEYKEYTGRQGKQSESLALEEESTPGDLIEKGVQEKNSELTEQLNERIKNLGHYDFERVILQLLEAMGYGEYETTPKSRDGGIDGIINQDKLGLDKIYIQTKHFKEETKVGTNMLSAFIGAIKLGGKTDKGIFVTSSKFVENTKEIAKTHKVRLIDGDELVKLMFEHNIGVKDKNKITIKELDEDFFDQFAQND